MPTQKFNFITSKINELQIVNTSDSLDRSRKIKIPMPPRMIRGVSKDQYRWYTIKPFSNEWHFLLQRNRIPHTKKDMQVLIDGKYAGFNPRARRVARRILVDGGYMVPPGYRATYRVDAVNSRGYKVQAIADGERIRGVGITIRKISDRVWRGFLRKYRAAFLGSANAVTVTTVGGVRMHTNPSVNINTRLVSDHNYLLDKLIPFLASVVDQTHEFLIEVKMEVNGAGKIVWLTPRDINNVDTLKQIIKDGDIADIAAAYSEGYKSADWILDFARGGFKSITSARVVNNLKRLSNRIERGERQEFFKYKLRSEYALSVGPIVARYGIYPDYVKARYKQCCLYYCFEREGSFSRTKLLLLNNIIAKEIRVKLIYEGRR